YKERTLFRKGKVFKNGRKLRAGQLTAETVCELMIIFPDKKVKQMAGHHNFKKYQFTRLSFSVDF
ncbi:MAG TPA: hypothetical protein VEC36_12850, partial [Patescibacteria group bacterium]|nr:hypothetical protein [Patescibacteria group bacterium]